MSFRRNQYTIREKAFSFFHRAFYIYDDVGRLAFFSRQDAFKLKQDIRVYSDETMAEEVLVIKAREIIDFAAAYDVIDPKTDEKVGVMKRKGWKSLVRDEWIIMDAHDREIGLIQEDRAISLIRRLFFNLVLERFHGYIGNRQVCMFEQRFHLFVLVVTLDFTPDTNGFLDRRLGIAAGLLLSVIPSPQVSFQD